MFLEKKTLHKIWLNPGLKLTAPFEQSVFIWYGTGKISGAPNVNFRKISQCSEDDLRSIIFRNTCKISSLPVSPWIFEHFKNVIIAHF